MGYHRCHCWGVFFWLVRFEVVSERGDGGGEGEG